MWLKLNLSGINFKFRILDYAKSSLENWDEEWCNVGISYQAEDWLNYTREEDETLLCSEVELIAKTLQELLDNKLEDSTTLEFLEPDFTLIFNPKQDEDISLEWKIGFWTEGFTDNYLSLRLKHSDIILLQKYFDYVMGTLPETELQELISNNVFEQ